MRSSGVEMQVAADFGVVPRRISQIRREVLDKLRNADGEALQQVVELSLP